MIRKVLRHSWVDLLTFFGVIALLPFMAQAAEDATQDSKTAPVIKALAPYTGPTIAAPADAPAIVILPPLVSEDAQPGVLQAAEAACDRLAGELAAGGTVQIVNRTELQKILQERKAAGQVNKPITSYSAMVRLEVATTLGETQATVNLIDLSTGNVLGRHESDWPLKEADIPSLKDTCLKAIKTSAKQTDGKARIRLLGVIDVGESTRLFPLAHRLTFMYREALAKSPQAILLQHLEARTSKEESLLLLMGLSRSPGTSRFTPQADATIELRVLERESVGKTFPETIVAVGVRLKKATKPQSDWLETTGAVKEFDGLMETSWRQLAIKLKSARPDAFGKTLHEFQVRRQQAETELRSADAKLRSISRADHAKSIRQIEQAIAHCETALKLDPTFAAAQLKLSNSVSSQFNYLVTSMGQTPNSSKIERVFHRLLLEYAAYLQHPHVETDKRADCIGAVTFALVRRNRTARDRSLWGESKELTSDKQGTLDALKTILLEGTRSRGNPFPPNPYHLIPVVFEGMQRAKTTREERAALLMHVIKNVDGTLPQARQDGSALSRGAKQQRLIAQLYRFRTRLQAAELLIVDHDAKAARRLMLEARNNEMPTAEVNPSYSFSVKNYVRDVRSVAVKLKDPDVLKEFESWKKTFLGEVKPQKVELLRVRYYEVVRQLSAEDKQVPVPEVYLTDFQKPTNPRGRAFYLKYGNVKPLAHAKDRLYVTVEGASNVELIAYVPLLAQGGPAGSTKEVMQVRKTKYVTWDRFHFLPNIALNKRAEGRINQAVVDQQGRLILAVDASGRNARKAGLSIYSPKTKQWTTIGAEDGLPVASFRSFFVLDDNRLLCAGVGNEKGKFDFFVAHFIVNLETKESQFLHRTTKETSRAGLHYCKYLKPVWWVDGKLNGPFATDLLSQQPKKRTRWLTATDYAEIGNRRFVLSREKQLTEYDQQERVVHQWRSYNVNQHPLFQRVLYIPGMGNSPYKTGRLATTDKYLVVQSQNGRGVMLLDPKSDTWYGPVGDFQWSDAAGLNLRKNAIGTNSGLWIHDAQDKKGVRYVKTSDILQAAQAAGRVYTTAQYRKARQQKIQTLPLQQRAIARILTRDYVHGVNDLRLWNKQEPNNAEALFLLGVAHEPFGLNKPEIAVGYYEQLVQLPNPSAKLNGLLALFSQHEQAERWQQVIDTGNKIMKLSSFLPFQVEPQVTYRVKVSHERLKQQGATTKSPVSASK